MSKTKLCMIVQHPEVKGGISSVINAYRKSDINVLNEINYVESYVDGGKFKKILKGLMGYVNFIKVVALNRPHLIHIHSSFGASFYRKLPYIYISKVMRISIINHIHGADFESFYLKAPKMKKRYIKRIYNMCDCLIALSDEWKDNLNAIVPNSKITVIKNFSQIAKESSENLANSNKNTNYKVLFLGEIGTRKGCYDIPHIAEIVLGKIPNVEFVIGGSGEEEKLKQLINLNEKIRDNFVFPGWVRDKDKDKLLEDADIFLLPSYNEGMPMSILEAMGHSLPIVSTNIGGIPNIVINDINGYLLKPGDIKGLADSIVNILNNPDKRKILGDGSQDLVKKEYSLDAHLEKLQKLYLKMGKN